jgi:hypothetical protein
MIPACKPLHFPPRKRFTAIPFYLGGGKNIEFGVFFLKKWLFFAVFQLNKL